MDVEIFNGKYPNEFIDQPKVKKILKDSLGSEYENLIDRFEVVTPMEIDGDYLVGIGCQAHDCGTKGAAFAFSKDFKNIVIVIKYEKGGSHKWETKPEFEYPNKLNQWIAAVEVFRNLYKGDFLWYNGETVNGNIPNGKGTCYFKNGDQYKGDFLNGAMTGEGTYKSDDGVVYTGQLKDNKHHGKGILYWANGKVHYDGQWKNGKRNGYGKSYNQDGQLVYDGEWLDGKSHE